MQRTTGGDAVEDKFNSDAPNGSIDSIGSTKKAESSHSSSNLVFGYLNLFSDGVVCFFFSVIFMENKIIFL